MGNHTLFLLLSSLTRVFWKTQHPIPNSSLANSFTAHVPLQMLSSRLSPLGAILDLLGQGSHPCSVQASTGFHLGFPEIPLFENSHVELAGRPSVHICPLMNSFPEHKMRLTGKQRSNFSRCLFPHVETGQRCEARFIVSVAQCPRSHSSE